MPKHTLFLIHGIGLHGANWAEQVDGPIETLKKVSGSYAYFQSKPLEEKVEFVPIHYDSIFQEAATRWQNDANFLQQHDPTGTAGDLMGWLTNAGATEKNFWWTNVCDLVLYRLSAIYRKRVQTHVIAAIAEKIESLFDEGSANCSVLGHSMGTAVAHDCLHLLGTVRWGGAANPLGPAHWRFNHFFMVANTSRLLQTQDDQMKRAYESIVRPGPNLDPGSYCKTYWNIRHEADVVPFPRAFDPVGWTNYTPISIRHFHEVSIHNLSHHLINPRVHVPILRKLVSPKAVTDDELVRESNEDRFPQFAGPFEKIQRLKELGPRLLALRTEITADPSVTQLARSLAEILGPHREPRMRHWISVLGVLITIGQAASAWALDPREWEPDSTDSRSYEQVRARYRQDLAALDYPKVFRALQHDLEQSNVWSHRDSVYTRFARAVTSLCRSFEGYDLSTGTAAARVAALDSFLTHEETGAFQFPCPGDECLSGGDVVTYETLESLPDARAGDFLQRIQTLSRLLVDLKRPALRKTVSSIELARDRWATFVDHGRSQYPWEILANGWVLGSGTIERPPMKQLVLAHPTAAVEMTTEDIQELRAKQALAIEALGFIWYRWNNASKPTEGLRWWGLSAIASVREDMRPGVGMLLHYGRMVTFGATWHNDNSDNDWFDRPPFLIASFDLFQLAKQRVPEYERMLATSTARAAK